MNHEQIPHPDTENISINCAVITVSDTRDETSDRSGQIIRELLTSANHKIAAYTIIKDEPTQIQGLLLEKCDRNDVDVLIFNGGTGIAPRDTTYDAIAFLLEKTIPGFGEIFRFLSYEEIGSRAIASRAIAGIYRQKLIFCLPGSSNAVKLAMNRLILPELNHLVKQLRS
jgi:molybdenum cofactor biosynthesis protein B